MITEPIFKFYQIVIDGHLIKENFSLIKKDHLKNWKKCLSWNLEKFKYLKRENLRNYFGNLLCHTDSDDNCSPMHCFR